MANSSQRRSQVLADLLAHSGSLDDLGIRFGFKLPVAPLKIDLEAIAGPGAK